MFFSTKAFLSGAVSALLLTQGALADDCTTGPLAELSTIGQDHDGGTGFCYTKWAIGLNVVGIETWQTTWQIKAVKLFFSDGSNLSAGDQEQTGNSTDPDSGHQIFKWGNGDTFSDMTIAPNEANDGLGYIDFTVAGKKFHVESEYDNTKMLKVDIGCGIFLGAGGQAGGFMHRWTPLFLGTVNGDAKVTNMDFHETPDQLAKDTSGIEQYSLSQSYITNDNPVGSNDTGASWLFNVATKRTQSVTDSNTKSYTFGLELGVTVGGKVGIPLVAEGDISVSAKTSFQFQSSDTHSTEDGHEVDFTSQEGSSATGELLKAGHAKHCSAWVWQGHFSGDYTRTVEVNVNGQTYTFLQNGHLDTTSYTDNVHINCTDVLIKDIPNGANTTTASDSIGGQNGSNNQVKQIDAPKSTNTTTAAPGLTTNIPKIASKLLQDMIPSTGGGNTNTTQGTTDGATKGSPTQLKQRKRAQRFNA